MTTLRALILLLVALWVGGLMFFPVVAWAAFSTLPDAHVAGTVVRLCLHTLHAEGIAAGLALTVLLLAGRAIGAYTPRRVLGPLSCVLTMLALTAFSQGSIMPRMEVDRLAAGGNIDAAAAADPHRLDFNRLHVASVRIEGGVLAAGWLLIAFLGRLPQRNP